MQKPIDAGMVFCYCTDMQFHSDLPTVQMSYQNFGAAWLIILRGDNPQELELAQNSLFNHEASGGSFETNPDAPGLVTFWSSEKRLAQYFVNRYWWQHGGADGPEQAELAQVCAEEYIASLRECHETFIRRDAKEKYDVEPHGMGVTGAEKPDWDLGAEAVAIGVDKAGQNE